ncbi:MAG: chain length determinant protein EpsF [Methylococcaceae bacterium]|nr:chain length determinant protein EpsF [Methylococcaceae bacterium]
MNLQQFFTILYARKWRAFTYLGLTVLTTLVISLVIPKQYIATTSLFMEQRGVDPVTGGMMPTQLLSGYIATQADIIASHNVALRVVDHLNLTADKKYQDDFLKRNGVGDLRDWIAEALIKNLTVYPSHESSIIHVNYKSPDRKFSVQAANAFAKSYIQTTVDLKLQPAQQNADWFEMQLNSLREKMENSRENLSSFQQVSGIVNSNNRLDIEDARLAEIAQQLVVNQGHTYELTARKQQLTKALKNKSFESLQEILDNSFVQTLKSDLSRVEAQFAELSVKVDRNHPQYQQAAAEISNLKKKIAQEISTVLEGIDSSVAASKRRDEILAAELDKQKTKVLALKKQHNEIDVLTEEVANAQKTYDVAMQRSVQTRMESEASLSNIAILNPAILPQKHDSPKITLNLFLGTFLGTLLGIGAALLAELFDRRIRTPFDISTGLGLPVFGVMTKAPVTKKSRRSLGASL